MKLKFLKLFLFCTFSVVLNAQTFEVLEGDTINCLDENNLKQGRWIEYNNGVKIQEGNYKDNKKEGIWIKYYPNGETAHKATYVNNRPCGEMQFYYETGEILEEGTWKDERWVGEFKFYHKNGNLSYKWHYNEQGKRTGVQKYYHESGKLMIQGNWVDGIKEGEIKEYYEDGSLKSSKKFERGVMIKESLQVFAEGEKVEEKPATNVDHLDVFDGNGYYQLYNKHKKIDREGEFKEGKLVDGKRYYYDTNGLLVKTAIYQNGKVIRNIDSNQQ